MAENMAYKQSMNPRGQARRNGAPSAFPRVLRRSGGLIIPSVSKISIADRGASASRPVEIGAGAAGAADVNSRSSALLESELSRRA